MKSTATKEETYEVMLSQKISNRQNCEKFKNFRAAQWFQTQIHILKWTTRTEGLEKNYFDLTL